MPEHNHITRGDVEGCPSCDVREGRQPDPMRIPAIQDDYPRMPDSVKALPMATHRIRDEKAVCDGGHESRCHWYPGDECDHESWPCGHEYAAHDDCWIILFLDATELLDSASDESADLRDDEGTWPDGLIDTEWTGDWVCWWYLDTVPTEPTDGES